MSSYQCFQCHRWLAFTSSPDDLLGVINMFTLSESPSGEDVFRSSRSQVFRVRRELRGGCRCRFFEEGVDAGLLWREAADSNRPHVSRASGDKRAPPGRWLAVWM